MAAAELPEWFQYFDDDDFGMRTLALCELEAHIMAAKPLPDSVIVSYLEKSAGPAEPCARVRNFAAIMLISLQSRLATISGADRVFHAALAAQRAERAKPAGFPGDDPAEYRLCDSVDEIDSRIYDLECALASLSTAP